MKLVVPFALTLTLLLMTVVGCVDVKVRPAPEGGTPCSFDGDCAAVAPVCDTASTGTCVQCLPERSEACAGTTPACGGDYACRGCTAHTDCASDACLPDGSCAVESVVVYVSEGGGAGTACSKAERCGTLSAAMAAVTPSRPYVRMVGSLSELGLVITDRNVTFLGAAGSIISGGNGPGNVQAILDVRGTSKVELYDVTVSNGRMAAIRVDGTTASVNLVRSKILSAGAEGVSIISGKATISQSEISGCGGLSRRGISLTSGELTVTRSKIAENGGGIFIADNQKFTITNNFIVGNRATGGVQVSKPGVGSKLEFNTIADNRDDGTTGVADAGGVFCDEAGFTFGGNIIFRNTGGAGGYVQTAGACKFDGSFLSSNAAAETGSLGFVKDTLPRDYHLTVASPTTVRDVAGAVCTDMVDIDGEARPHGAGCDLGADETRL